MDILMKYHFPGNVRELENLIERAVILARDLLITRTDLPITLYPADKSNEARLSPIDFYDGNFRNRIESYEQDLINRALKNSDYNQSRAARELGLSERNLRYKIQKYNLK